MTLIVLEASEKRKVRSKFMNNLINLSTISIKPLTIVVNAQQIMVAWIFMARSM